MIGTINGRCSISSYIYCDKAGTRFVFIAIILTILYLLKISFRISIVLFFILSTRVLDLSVSIKPYAEMTGSVKRFFCLSSVTITDNNPSSAKCFLSFKI